MIVFDTETTGLIKAMDVPLEQQPEITEFAAVKLDKDLNEIDAISFLIKPKIPVGEETIRITGITNEMLTDQPSFARMLPTIQGFFLGEDTAVAHNISFDITMMALELRRLDYLTKFPWPPRQIDTVELTRDVQAKHSQESLVQLVTGKKAEVAHRALPDVRELCGILRWLRNLDGRV